MRFPSPFPVVFAEVAEAVVIEAEPLECHAELEAPTLAQSSAFVVESVELACDVLVPVVSRSTAISAEVLETGFTVLEGDLKRAHIILRLNSPASRTVKINSGILKTVKLSSESKYERVQIF